MTASAMQHRATACNNFEDVGQVRKSLGEEHCHLKPKERLRPGEQHTRFSQHMFHADVDGCAFIHDRFSFVGSAQNELCAVPKNECKCRGYKAHGHANTRAKSIGQDDGKIGA